MKKSLLLVVFCTLQVISSVAQARTVYYTTTVEPPETQQYCREYTQTLKIGSHTQRSHGTACMQPDGSWELMPATAQTGRPVPSITYIMRDDRMYYMPPEPLFGIVIGGRGHNEHRYNENHEEYRRHNH